LSTNRPRERRRANRRPAAPRARSRTPGPTAARRRESTSAVPAAGLRGALERASLPTLTRLTRAPRWLVGLVPAVVLLGGLLAPLPWGPVLLGVVALFLAWLLALAWPRLDARGKALRAGVVVLMVAATVLRALGIG
jgi:hypothetical protein